MLDYLVNYGIKRQTIDYSDIDVLDKMALQNQINEVRRNYSNLLSLLDEVQAKYLECNAKISAKSKELLSSSTDYRNKNDIFNTNDEYIELEIQQQALKTGMSMINAQIDYCKSDLRILNSVFYNKF